MYKEFLIIWGDTIDGDGVSDLATTSRIRNGWLKFRELFVISDIHSSPVGVERSSVCWLCQKQRDLWK